MSLLQRGRDGLWSVFVDNLPMDIRKWQLHQLFFLSGRVYDSYLSTKYRPSKRGPFAFVRFRTRKEAEMAMNDWDGRQLEDALLSVVPQ